MAEFASAADAPAARAVIHAMGFDDDIKLINLIPAKCTSCDVHDVATASSSAASFAASAVSFRGPPFGLLNDTSRRWFPVHRSHCWI